MDGQATNLRGGNISDEYFSHDSGLEFQDMDVLSLGSVDRVVSLSFDSYWNSEPSHPISVLGGQCPS